MKRSIFRHPSRLLAALALAAALGASSVQAQSAPAPASVPAGRYLVGFVGSCTPAAFKAPLCQHYPAPFNTFLVSVLLNCGSGGSCTFTGTYSGTEIHPGAPARCTATLLAKPFNTTCRMVDRGTVVIKRGMTGLPEFWIASNTVTIYNASDRAVASIHDPFGGPDNYPVDQGVPAIPGVYDTRQLSRLTHFHAPARGVIVTAVVTRG